MNSEESIGTYKVERRRMYAQGMLIVRSNVGYEDDEGSLTSIIRADEPCLCPPNPPFSLVFLSFFLPFLFFLFFSFPFVLGQKDGVQRSSRFIFL